jgi:hypothetical protein
VGQAFLPVKTSLNVSDPVWADQKKNILSYPLGRQVPKEMASQMSDLPLMSVKKLSLQWGQAFLPVKPSLNINDPVANQIKIFVFTHWSDRNV